MKKLEQLISPNKVGELFENIHVMITLVDSSGALISWNHAFGDYKKSNSPINKLEDIFLQQDRHQVNFKLSAASQEHWTSEIISNNGTPSFFDCALIPMSNGNLLFTAEKIASTPDTQKLIDRLNRQVKMFRLESEAAKKIARNKQVEMESVMIQAREVAQIDPLTFLLNRRMIVKELQSEVIRAVRYNSPLSISVMDIDYFKSVNDTYGHLVGDEVLRQVAYQLRDHTRQPDIAGRYGGEEFLILLPNSDLKAAAEQASRLCRQISQAVVQVQEHSIHVTVSIGIAQFRHEVDTWDTLLNRSDNAMYEAKRAGRNRWVVDE
ncbi:GGDEF domain-containing protein [Candidatus Villigracilis saccharophilus]|jgi:diguanylate cyclase (GGDEF)-like protein|uniref:GGDEF domain-containing protein n=1 Tax=Candidatus Villigracilis saccharophilus TaxID=3140684 RepID=UPI0031359197|nr:GGDEF domain-containing protein [Anaerolineales bacterium]